MLLLLLPMMLMSYGDVWFEIYLVNIILLTLCLPLLSAMWLAAVVVRFSRYYRRYSEDQVSCCCCCCCCCRRRQYLICVLTVICSHYSGKILQIKKANEQCCRVNQRKWDIKSSRTTYSTNGRFAPAFNLTTTILYCT